MWRTKILLTKLRNIGGYVALYDELNIGCYSNKVMAFPSLLLCESESWAPRKGDFRLMESSEMRFLRSVKTRRIRSNDIRQQFGVRTIIEIKSWYKQRWKDHVMHLSQDRMPRQAMEL